MTKIIVNPTPTSQWYDLVTAASYANHHKLDESIESYLVFMLMRFTASTQIVNHLAAISLLESAHQEAWQQQQTLRDTGDICLLLSGLFPGRAEKRRVRISYYMKLGQTAYLTLANNLRTTHHDSELFTNLGKKFVTLMEILQVMRELNDQNASLEPLQATEIWQDTGSAHALKTLSKFTHSQPVAAWASSTARH